MSGPCFVFSFVMSFLPSFAIILMGKRAGCFTLIVVLVACDCLCSIVCVGFLLLRYSVLFTLESLSLLYLLVIS